MTATACSFTPPRPLCVFRVLYKGAPLLAVDGRPVEFGSHQAADDYARRVASQWVTALSNFAVARAWL